MSWAGPDTFPATSLADNLDKDCHSMAASFRRPFTQSLRYARWSTEQANSSEKLLVILRDGRKLVGVLRSFDQFANVVLERSIERITVGDLFCDLPLGLYVIRGENVVLIGELDPVKDELPSYMVRVSPADIRRAQKAERDATDLKGTMRKRMEFLDLD